MGYEGGRHDQALVVNHEEPPNSGGESGGGLKP